MARTLTSDGDDGNSDNDDADSSATTSARANRAVFAGKGRYQLYRQGNLTWRLDTDNGRTCILFATEEEWHKQRVFSHGCAGE